jgi:hypothetical protein
MDDYLFRGRAATMPPQQLVRKQHLSPIKLREPPPVAVRWRLRRSAQSEQWHAEPRFVNRDPQRRRRSRSSCEKWRKANIRHSAEDEPVGEAGVSRQGGWLEYGYAA